MRFGCCVPIEHAGIVEELGYDYVELPVTCTLQPGIDEAEYARIRGRLRSLAIMPEAFNSFLREDLRLVGPQVDMGALESYVRTVFRRAMELGGEIVVFGGKGAARSIPDGFSPEIARAQLLEFLRVLSEHAADSGLTVAIEPLNRQEADLINTIGEALSIVEEIDREEVKILVDAYHVAKEGDLEMVQKAAEHLVHVHVADTNRYPPGCGSFDFSQFFTALHHAGYEGRVSVECLFTDLVTQSGKALRFLREVAGESHSEGP